MGADLYLGSVFEKHRDKYQSKFYQWASRRDALQKAGKKQAADKAQRQASKYFAKMYERGYFRDSYNRTSLLWLFDLSWWGDVLNVLTDEEGMMDTAAARRFLRLLESREANFEANLGKVELVDGQMRAEVESYFRDKYSGLKAFLCEAIKQQEPIECSL